MTAKTSNDSASQHLNQRQVADRVGLTYGAVRNLRAAGGLPDPDVLWDSRPYWLPSTIDAWEASRRAAE